MYGSDKYLGVPSMGQIDLFENYSYSIKTLAKILLKKQIHKNCKYERPMNSIP